MRIWEDRISTLDLGFGFFNEMLEDINYLPLLKLNKKIQDKTCKILDIWSWLGFFVEAWIKKGYNITWVDNFPRSPLVEWGEIHNLNFRDWEFDLVFSHLVFDHKEYPQQQRSIMKHWITMREAMISEAHRVLHPMWLYYALEPISKKEIEDTWYRIPHRSNLFIPEYCKKNTWRFIPRISPPIEIIPFNN